MTDWRDVHGYHKTTLLAQYPPLYKGKLFDTVYVMALSGKLENDKEAPKSIGIAIDCSSVPFISDVNEGQVVGANQAPADN